MTRYVITVLGVFGLGVLGFLAAVARLRPGGLQPVRAPAGYTLPPLPTEEEFRELIG